MAPRWLSRFLGLFLDMSFVEQESLDYFEVTINAIISEAQNQAHLSSTSVGIYQYPVIVTFTTLLLTSRLDFYNIKNF